MKTLLLLMLSAALLWGCETTSANKQYWQARANAIAGLPQEQQAYARIEMLRDWQAQKNTEDAARDERWARAGAILAQAGHDYATSQSRRCYTPTYVPTYVPTYIPTPTYVPPPPTFTPTYMPPPTYQGPVGSAMRSAGF
jgi:hypothetical protein